MVGKTNKDVENYEHFKNLASQIGINLDENTARKFANSYIESVVIPSYTHDGCIPFNDNNRKSFWKAFQKYSPVNISDDDIDFLIKDGEEDDMLMAYWIGDSSTNKARDIMGKFITVLYSASQYGTEPHLV